MNLRKDAFPVHPSGMDFEHAVTILTPLKVNGENGTCLEIGPDSYGFVKAFNMHIISPHKCVVK